MALIPEETLQAILAATDIVDLIGRYVKLRRAGVNYVGLCPFHQEKTPSFNVQLAQGRYHCFGCGESGSAFTFLQKHDGLTFQDAVRRLADAAGIRIQEEVYDPLVDKEARIRKALLKIHSEIADWYHSLLLKDEIAGPARDYLKSRGLSAEVAKNWKVGYAPASGQLLRQWAEPRKFSEKLLRIAGILAEGGEESGRAGQSYPRFRHRLMFPIRNEQGEVIAFSGRLLDPNAKSAKYLNSPETKLFSKSKVLFGFDKARRAIVKAGRAIICEGQLDMITAFENGFQNIVASQGTAFTEYHARVIKRHADEVVLCFDSDNAGYKAAERSYAILAPAGLVVKVAPLPPGEDPDSLIRNHGPEAFQRQLDQATNYFDHMVNFAVRHRNLREVGEKTRFAGEMAGSIRLLENPIARDDAIQRVCTGLGIPDAEFRRQISRIKKPPPHGAKGAAQKEAGPPVSPPLPPQDPHAELIVKLALSSAEILQWLRQNSRKEILSEISGMDVLALIWNSASDLTEPGALAVFMSTLRPEEATALSRILAQPAAQGGLDAAQQSMELLQLTRAQNLQLRIAQLLKQTPNTDPDIGVLFQQAQQAAQDVKRLKAQIALRNRPTL